MCRFALYVGPPIRLAALLTRPEHSLVSQARHSFEGAEETNPDGWGVAWYVPHLAATPALYKDVTPAWRSRALQLIARGMRSRLILAHVRAASAGLGVSQDNCHPFRWRTLTFMHNGAIEDFDLLRPALWEHLSERARAEVHGTTDSEHVFALLTDRWLDSRAHGSLARLTDAVRRTLADLAGLRHACRSTEPAFLNLAVADGFNAVVSRATLGRGAAARSLYVRTGKRPARVGDAPKRQERFVVIASEPLEVTDEWQRVRAGDLVLVDEHRRVAVEPIGLRSVRRRVA